MEILEVNNIVRQALSSFYIPSNINILARYTKDLLVITIEKSKIIRVLDNIVRNAIEAMTDGGLITINVLKKGEFAAIEIKDTGEGVPEDIKEKLFEPFNTSKPKHEGLGLAYSKKIIESSGGKISLRSEIGKGTTVMISIPIINK